MLFSVRRLFGAFTAYAVPRKLRGKRFPSPLSARIAGIGFIPNKRSFSTPGKIRRFSNVPNAVNEIPAADRMIWIEFYSVVLDDKKKSVRLTYAASMYDYKGMK